MSLRDAAMHWVDCAVGFQARGNGRLGWGHRLSGDSVWHDSPGLTVGKAGGALALAAAISDVEPHWDRLFVLS